MYHLHTKETLTITFKRNGVYDAAAMKQASWFLRDWRKNEATTMEPRLFDIIWEVYRETGASDAVNIVCGYRSPGTNEMLRSRSRGVAKFSQHTLGRAMDFFIPGVALTSIREVGIRLQRGGVGFYPTSGSPFVHLDVGNIRAWPRMTRAQLARVFPDGRTVHLPAEGGRMAGYDVALADIQKRGATVSRAWNAAPPRGAAMAGGDAPAASGKKRNFLARLLGMDEGDDGDEESASPIETGRERPVSIVAVKPASVPAAVPSRAAEPDEEAVPAPAPVQTAAPVKPASVPLPVPAPLAKDEPAVAAAALPASQPQARSAALLAYAGALPPPPMPADPADLPPAQPGRGMIWVQGPAGTQYAAPAEPAALAAAAPQIAAEAVILPGTAVPLPRPKPDATVTMQVASLSPQPMPVQPIPVQPVRQPASRSMAVASRIAAAYAQTVQATTATPSPDPIALRGNTTNGGLALASRIATANAVLRASARPAPATAVAQAAGSGSGSGLPENFAAQARQLVGERVALAYASPDLLMSGPRGRNAVLPLSLNRSIALAAPRRPVRGAILVTAKLDRKGWQEACKPQSARTDAAAETPPVVDAEPQLLAAPLEALPYSFGSDPTFGTKTGRFAGSPVMFIRSVPFARTRTAELD